MKLQKGEQNMLRGLLHRLAVYRYVFAKLCPFILKLFFIVDKSLFLAELISSTDIIMYSINTGIHK